MGLSEGGGKSFFLCLWSVTWLYHLIEFFGIEKTKYPLALGFMGRKRGVDFNDTTLETFKKAIPYHMYKIREQDKEIVFEDKAKICYGGLDDEININKFNSAEFSFIAIDQAEETLRQDVAVLQATLRQRINHKCPPYKELYTANPAECWLKEDFILGQRNNSVFIPALPDDNPYLPDNYKETLRQAFSYDEALLKAYLEGDWDAFSNVENALFRPNWFISCKEKAFPEDSVPDDAIQIISADVATKHGQNLTVILHRIGNTIKSVDSYKHIPTTKIAFLIKKIYERTRSNCIVVDSDGFGEGVADTLEAQNIGVTEFHGGYASKAIDQRRFKNLRTQFYMITARKVEEGLISFKPLDKQSYEILKSQCCAIKQKPPDPLSRYQIETKEEMSGRGIKSPDYGDALMMSEYGLWISKYASLKEYSYR